MHWLPSEAESLGKHHLGGICQLKTAEQRWAHGFSKPLHYYAFGTKQTSYGIAKTITSCLRWAEAGWMLGVHQATLSLPSSARTRERKPNERFVGLDKDRERLLTSNHHRQNKLDLGKIYVLPE